MSASAHDDVLHLMHCSRVDDSKEGRVVRFVAPHIVIVCIVSKARDLCILIVFSPLLIV